MIKHSHVDSLRCKALTGLKFFTFKSSEESWKVGIPFLPLTQHFVNFSWGKIPFYYLTSCLSFAKYHLDVIFQRKMTFHSCGSPFHFLCEIRAVSSFSGGGGWSKYSVTPVNSVVSVNSSFWEGVLQFSNFIGRGSSSFIWGITGQLS